MIGQINKEYIQTRRWKLWARFMAYFLFEGRPITTRGQWFNHLVFLGMAIWRNLPRFRKIDEPVYIIGSGRSGTTILGIVFSMHRKVGFLNEPKALWHKVIPTEDIIGSYDQGEEVYYRLTAEQATPKMARRLKNYYGAYAFWSGSRFVVDKYPELVFRVPFVKALMPKAKYIFIARNGWNTIHSIDKWSDNHGKKRHTGEIHDWWGVDDRKWKLLVSQVAAKHPAFEAHVDHLRQEDDHRIRAAVEWVLTMQEGLKLKETLGDQLLFLPYENLTESVEDTMEVIREFCGLPEDKTWVKYATQVLKPNKRKESVTLPDFLQQEFLDTMKALGYTS